MHRGVRLSRQRAADVSLDGVQLGTLFRGSEARRVTARAGTRRATDPMHVVLDRPGQVVVDDALNLRDVDAAGRDVGGDQDAVAAAAEAFQRLTALRLRAIRMQALHGVAGVAQRARQAIGAMLGAREHQHRTGVLLDQRQQQGSLVGTLDEVDVLSRFARRRRQPADVDTYGIAQVHPCQDAEIRGECRREQQRLPWRWHGAHDAIELRLEPHVEHAIGFVEHKHMHVLEHESAAFEVIDQSPRGGHDNRGPAAQCAELRAVGDATDHERGAQRATETLCPHMRLFGKLARRRQDQGAALIPVATRGAQPLNDWNDERGGFARAGLGGADDVAAGECRRDGLCLNRCGRMVACRLERGVQRCREGKLCKACWCRIQKTHEPFVCARAPIAIGRRVEPRETDPVAIGSGPVDTTLWVYAARQLRASRLGVRRRGSADGGMGTT